MIPIPPLNFNGADSSATGSHSGNSFEIPFVFDNSGWNVNIKGQGSQSAEGSTGQGRSGGTGSVPTSSSGMGQGISSTTLLIVAALALLLIVRK